MNPLTILGLIPTILRLVSIIRAAITTGLSFKNITDLIQNPDVLSIFKELGSSLFPNVKPELQTSAAVVATFSPEYVKWVQNAANRLISPSPAIDIDGHYGPKTRAAVEKLQAKLGLVVDGWAGDNSKAAITTALTKLETSTLVTPAPEMPKA